MFTVKRKAKSICSQNVFNYREEIQLFCDGLNNEGIEEIGKMFEGGSLFHPKNDFKKPIKRQKQLKGP